MTDFENPPETPGARLGDEPQREMMEEADHERMVHDTEEIHREEAAEEGKTASKKPWWKFWG